MKEKSDEWLVVASVRKPHGLKGLMRIHSFSGSFDHIESADEVKIFIQNQFKKVRIEKKVRKGCELLLKLEGIDSPEAVKAISRSEIFLPRESLEPCTKDEFYIADLITCQLIFQGEKCGEIVGVITNAPNDLLEVQLLSSKKVLVPMLKQFVGKIDLDKKKIELLEGWFLE